MRAEQEIRERLKMLQLIEEGKNEDLTAVSKPLSYLRMRTILIKKEVLEWVLS